MNANPDSDSERYAQADIDGTTPTRTLECDDGQVALYDTECGRWLERRHDSDAEDFHTEVYRLQIHSSRLSSTSRFSPYAENVDEMVEYAKAVLFGDSEAESVEYSSGGEANIVIDDENHTLEARVQTGTNHVID